MKYNYDLIQEWFEKRNFYFSYYAEQSIVISNWNRVPQAMTDYLEKQHELYYEDDGSDCSHCYKFVNRNDDQVLLECDLLCRECAEGNLEWVYNEFIFHALDKPYQYRALPSWLPVPKDFDLFDCGMENGFYAGMSDTPEKAVRDATKQMGDRWEGIFKVDSSNPFMVEFSIYVRKEVL